MLHSAMSNMQIGARRSAKLCTGIGADLAKLYKIISAHVVRVNNAWLIVFELVVVP